MSKVLVAISNFYPKVSRELTSSALIELKALNIHYDEIYVPGSYDLPGAINIALESLEYAGVIALGCVLKGKTSHYEMITRETARALQDISIYYSVPLGFGLITAHDKEQASIRAKDYGRRAAVTCIELMKVKDFYHNHSSKNVSLFN